MTKHQKIEGCHISIGAPSSSGPRLPASSSATRRRKSATPWPPLPPIPSRHLVGYQPRRQGLVTVGKADMGQHISSTMAQLVAEELEASWKDMGIVLASNDPKYNDPDTRRPVDRRELSHRDELRCDVPRRRGRSPHAHQGGCRDDGRAGERIAGAQITRSSCEVEEEPDLCGDREERQGQQGLDGGRAQGDQAEDPGPVHQDRPLAAAARHPVEDQRHLQIRHRRASFRACCTASWRSRRCATARR